MNFSENRVIVGIDRIFQKVIDGIGAALLFALLAVVTAQVIARYVVGGSVAWSEEVTRLLFVWMVLIAAAGTTHLRIDVLLLMLTKRSRLLAECTIAALSVGLLVFLVWSGDLVIDVIGSEEYPILGISVQYLYWSVVVGSILWIIGTILALLRLFR